MPGTCPNCQTQFSDGSVFCSRCGQRVDSGVTVTASSYARPYPAQVRLGRKSMGVAYLLWFLGGAGAFPLHMFYLGKVPVMKIITLNYVWIGSVVDFVKMFEYVNEYNRGVS
jgi:hypothetical protein